jgi:hypothetical protein
MRCVSDSRHVPHSPGTIPGSLDIQVSFQRATTKIKLTAIRWKPLNHLMRINVLGSVNSAAAVIKVAVIVGEPR